jgi:hypothetical protein
MGGDSKMKCEYRPIRNAGKCYNKAKWHVWSVDENTGGKGEVMTLCEKHAVLVTYVLDVFGLCWGSGTIPVKPIKKMKRTWNES